MKISEWLDDLPDGSRELAVENFIENGSRDGEVKCMADAIYELSWNCGSTGAGIMGGLYDHYRNGTPLPPLPEKELSKARKVEGIKNNIGAITDERGSNYGHPYDHFNCTQEMYHTWMERRNGGEAPNEEELCLNHIVYMILDKLSRAAQNPMHMDNFDDIQGYASLWAKCVEKNKGEI